MTGTHAKLGAFRVDERVLAEARRRSIEGDAHYMGGWPPDVAGRRSSYDVLEDRMQDAVALAFDIDPAALASPALRTADMWSVRIEAERLTDSGGALWRWPGDLPNDGRCPAEVVWTGGVEPSAARVLWLDAAEAPADQYEPCDGRAAP